MNPRHSVPQTDALPTELHPPFARLSGLEPLTNGLEGRCSIQLSYRRPGDPPRKVAFTCSLYRPAFKEPLQIPIWSGREDLNLRPPVPKTGALPDCATPRQERIRRRRKLAARWQIVNEKVSSLCRRVPSAHLKYVRTAGKQLRNHR